MEKTSCTHSVTGYLLKQKKAEHNNFSYFLYGLGSPYRRWQNMIFSVKGIKHFRLFFYKFREVLTNYSVDIISSDKKSQFF